MTADPAADQRQGRPLDCTSPPFSSHHEAAWRRPRREARAPCGISSRSAKGCRHEVIWTRLTRAAIEKPTLARRSDNGTAGRRAAIKLPGATLSACPSRRLQPVASLHIAECFSFITSACYGTTQRAIVSAIGSAMRCTCGLRSKRLQQHLYAHPVWKIRLNQLPGPAAEV